MREILFRGKTEKGEWLFGFYHNETSIESPSSDRKITRHHIYTQDFDKFVIPETVGQFTGLTDKNGKKIFEGDIVKGYLGYGDDENDIAYIEYQEDSMGFVLVEILKEDFGKQFEMTDYVEVIGNIHDTPELLGERK